MKWLFVVTMLAVTGCCWVGCTRKGSGNGDEPIGGPIPPGTWLVESLTVDGQPVDLAAAPTLTIHFDGYRAFGSGGCNSYEARFQSPQDGEIRLTEQSWTEMACDLPSIEEIDAKYAQLLSKVQKYSLTANKLVLSDGTDTNQVACVREVTEPALPLTGTSWQLDVFEEQAGTGAAGTVAATFTLDDAPITLVVQPDGKAAGSTGCNQWQANTRLDDRELKFRDISATEIGCRQAILEQEKRFLEELARVGRYTVEGNRLRLFNADGTRILNFVAK